MSSGRNNRISNQVIYAQYAQHGRASCEYCGKEVFSNVPVTANNRVIGDHRIPMSRGGPNTPDNIAIACKECDFMKGPLTKEEFLSVFNDTIKRKHLINKVLYDLGKVPRIYDHELSRNRFSYERNLARRNSLTDRLKDPDPNCTFCSGKGTLKKRGRLFHYCRCSVIPKEKDNEAT